MDSPETDRPALMQHLCHGEIEIESELQGLLSAHEKAGNFLHEPAAIPLDGVLFERAGRDLSGGTVLAGRFHILRLLNSGGMGTVYEAWDLELQEALALKTIRPEIASEPSVIERFKREVSQARQVTHPNICRVYDLFNHDFGPGDRIWFLTMQLLKGPTLLERIREKGPFTSKEALMLVQQMVAGLAAAHEHGIVHRDFKSGNVMLVQSPENGIQAVITDFGLASQATAADAIWRVQAGQGTPAYAAPEQWLDGVVTPAGDQYSLGVVMCEMLTGERPAHAARHPGSALSLPPGKKIEARWDSAIRRCLEIKPDNRFGSLDDLLAALDPTHRRRLVLNWVAGAAVVSLVTVTGLMVSSNLNRLPSLTELKLLTPATNFSQAPNLSADGKTIAYVSDRAEAGNLDVWLQRLPDGVPKRITRDPAIDESPSVSPDGHLVAFESSRNPPGIYLADEDGRSERLLVPGGHNPAFSPGGRLVLYWTGTEYSLQPTGKLFLLDLNTGRSIQLASGMKDARTPVWNSDGRHILFAGCADTKRPFPACKDWWITSTDGETPRATGAIEVLISQGLRPSIYFGGWQGDAVVFSAAHNSSIGLWEIELNAAKAKVHGIAKQLISGDNRDFIVSSSIVGNSLAIGQWNPAVHIWRIEHAGSPARAKATKITNDPEFDLGPSVSHNGRWLIFARGYSNDREIRVEDTSTGMERFLRFDESTKYAPIIDDSGTTIAYEASENGVPGIWVATLGGPHNKLCSECGNPTGWLGDGKAILFGNAALTEVKVQDVAGGRAHTILSVPGGAVRDAVWSPENGFILFTVLKPDTNGQIFAARISPGADAPDDHWVEISAASDFSRKPRWSGDGKTIYYLSKKDGNWCVWGQHFNSVLGRAAGNAFPVQHFHDQKFSPAAINAAGLNLSAGGDSLYLNVLETGGTIYLGKLAKTSLFSGSR
ncbi:MAG: protein kinase [Terracidiphilus sp.]|jgi:serine/threonine protein kinase